MDPRAVSVQGCDCLRHAALTGGHEGDRETFTIRSVCPMCSESDTLELCVGRVLALLGDEALRVVVCPVCGVGAPATRFWRAIEFTAAISPRETPTCRAGRQCVGC